MRAGAVTKETVDPGALGLPAAAPDALRGADAAFNASVVRSVLAGQHGPVRDAVLLNAAAALVAVDAVEGPLLGQLAAALRRAAQAVDSGAAASVLERWVAATQSAGG